MFILNIKGNTILVTGGASGIGYQFSKKFYNNDNQIIVCGRNTEKLTTLEVNFLKSLPSNVMLHMPMKELHCLSG